MKKTILLLLFVTTIAQSQIVNIPDANFKAKLLSATSGNQIAKDLNGNYFKIDSNSDNEIQESEALEVSYLDVSSSSILDLTGIASFFNLEYLDCFNNELISLDLTANTNLAYLQCAYNSLTALDVNVLNELRYLYCYHNNITSFDIINLPNLELINFDDNLLTSLSLLNLPNLINLNGDNNQITTLNLNGLNSIESMSFSNNLITNIDLSNLISLTFLSCSSNPITTLDCSNNINLEFLTLIDCNLLESLYVKNGSIDELNEDSLIGCVNLEFICADDSELVAITQSLINNGLSGVNVNSYCSFTPGGDYNTIEGIVQYDFNEDGCNVLDSPASYTRIDVNLDGITTNSSVFSNEAGVYNLFTSTTGVFNLVPNIENPSFFNINPIAVDVPVMTIDNAVATQNFCITANGVHPDLEIVIAPIIPARPGFTAEYKIVYRNKGNQMMSQLYGINFFYNQHLMTFVSATQTPSSIVSGGLSWDYANLMPFESRSINVVMQINAPTDTDPVNIGDVLQFTSSIMPMTGDESTVDNLFQFNQTVVGSFDPNDITCIEGEVVDPSYIGEYLHYVINFENTGTAPAENVVVKLEINPSDFDINSLRILESSHISSIKITNNILEIIFQTIMLETGGHGNVLLKVRSKDNLTINDMVTNNAKIYFDYNFPILTNDANTVFQTLSNAIPVKDVLVKIYPNPTTNVLNIETVSDLKSIELYDVNGRILEINKLNHNRAVFDFSKYKVGLYFVKITTEDGSKIEKIIKE